MASHRAIDCAPKRTSSPGASGRKATATSSSSLRRSAAPSSESGIWLARNRPVIGQLLPLMDAIAAPRRLHAQVVDALVRMIAGGELAPGDLLPTEPEMSVRFGVSRSVV